MGVEIKGSTATASTARIVTATARSTKAITNGIMMVAIIAWKNMTAGRNSNENVQL